MQTISQHRAEKIARNINAMDTSYQYIDNMRKWRFWDQLDKKIREKLSNLTPEDKQAIADLCEKKEAEFFGIKKE